MGEETSTPLGAEESTAALFSLAVTAECKGRDFYAELWRRFEDVPAVAEFWKELRDDEVEHAQTLEGVCDSLAPEQLSEPVDRAMLTRLRTTVGLLSEARRQSIRTLDDAYELAHEFENSEINAVFVFLTNRFVGSTTRKTFYVSEIEHHQGKLVHFTERFGGPEWRRSIPAHPAGSCHKSDC